MPTITYKIGLFFIILLCTRYCQATSNTTTEATATTGYFDEDDYDYEDYGSQEEDDGVIREFPPNSKTTISKLQSTTSRTTVNTLKMNESDDILESNNETIEKCPEKCDCTIDYQFINCSNSNLDHIPMDIPETALRLDLSHNLISELRPDDFINCENLEELYLNGNKIKKLNKEVFTNLKRLDHIDLSYNSLNEIEPNTFSDVTDLIRLNLSYNSLKIPMNNSFLNQPNLKELYLINCNLEKIYDNTFRNMTGLTSLALNQNDLKKKINTKAFEPLKNLGKLRLPEIEQDNIKELCNILLSIDIINLKDVDVSCFELVAGTPFEESIVGRGGITRAPQLELLGGALNPPNDSGTGRDQKQQLNGLKTNIRGGTTMSPPNSLTTIPDLDADEDNFNNNNNNNNTKKIGQEGGNDDSTTPTGDDDNGTYQVAVSSQTINQILIGIMIVAVVGIAIGVIFRKDFCGIKTKLCRTRRPPTTDQVRPAEEIPLNKV